MIISILNFHQGKLLLYQWPNDAFAPYQELNRSGPMKHVPKHKTQDIIEHEYVDIVNL